MLVCGFIANISACRGPSAEQSAQRNKVGQKVSPAEAGINQDLALKFLMGIQTVDKNKMYEVANITTEIVNESREKLIQIKQNKISDKQRLECEHALRISGNIDFFISKMGKMFPKSSAYQITQTTSKDAAADTKHYDHAVTITYNNKAEAMSDKTGQSVKVMVVHLQQIDRSVSGRLIRDFSFDSKDFEKISIKDFEVLSYY